MWASLESVLCSHLEAFLRVEHFRARIVWSAMPNWRARRELLVRLAETYLAEDQLPAYRALIKRTKGIGENRNALAHRTSGVHQESGKIMVMGDAGHGDYGMEFLRTDFYDLTNVQNWARDTERLRSDLAMFPLSVNTSSRMHLALRDDPTLEIGPRSPTTRARQKPPPR
jgi:hypothetical protein